ncbi:MAG TPA: hypothetical protein VNY78_07260 [Edaphobacter sp.]|jgi:hypothetical protein|nr:hypothetical protein [Edaphobacter sp.]
MRVLLTAVVLASLLLAIILLRVFWARVPAKARSFLIYTGLAMMFLHIAFTLSKWSTTSYRLNAIINWGAVAGYMLAIALFTLLRPRWLTTISAVILILPVFATNIFLPLLDLTSDSPRVTRIDRHYTYSQTFWDISGENQNSGVDLVVFYQPRFLPLRRKVQRATFNDMKCDASASSASLDRDSKIIHFHCPASPSKAGSAPIDLLLPLQ